LSRHYQVPLFFLDVPFSGKRGSDAFAHDYVKKQMEELVVFLEGITGKRLDRDRLKEVLRISEETCGYWKGIVSSAAQIPSPLTVFDQFIAMALIVSQRGSSGALDFYKTLKSEIDERVRSRIAVQQNVIDSTDNLPLAELKWLSDLLASFGACVQRSIHCRDKP
jgi:benzoyl-CoA reductase/2-hydroxyglutaryl-CoA dehydratase subunit BcrC/BadD/HgdB